VLADFLQHENAQLAQLNEAHVVSLRLYSTAAFRSLNDPLRNAARTTAHPFAATIFFLADGIKKLRAVEAEKAERARAAAMQSGGGSVGDSMDLWRGMRNLAAADGFCKLGGSEPALMSTTSDLSIALRYGLSASSLLFKIHTTSFMTRGADISFLSAFPAECEYLYPPLTYLHPSGRASEVTFTAAELGVEGAADLSDSDGTVRFTIIEVEPQMG